MPTEPATLPPVVVTATRQAQKAFDVPAAISTVDALAVENGGPQINLSESLARVPGVAVNNRQNLAQDLQVVSRGFGARSTFGVRGVRLYADGIPATMPDGQGQTSSFDLGSAARIEVLRGPFSALYGNASGGVIQVFTEDGPAAPEVSAGWSVGSYDLAKYGVKAGGTSGSLNYVFDVSNFETDGYRDHSAAHRGQFNAKLRWTLAAGESLTAVVNAVRLPEAQDPLGLTRAQFSADPAQAGTDAVHFNTRKRTDQSQLGVVWQQRAGLNEFYVMGYGGERSVEQFQAIPTTSQTAASSPGGVIKLARRYAGLDARYTRRGALLDQSWLLTTGVALDQMDEHRTGYQNYLNTTPKTLGVEGALRRDEQNAVANADPYLQAQWSPVEALGLTAGVRRNSVRLNSQDHYVVRGNANDSGSARFASTVPVLGAVWHASEQVNVYANTGRSFETPTLNEMAYRSSGTGLNTNLNASNGRHLELGSKWAPSASSGVNAAVFRVRTRDEIAVLTNSGGRSTYQNVGRTTRAGLELDAQTQWGGPSGRVWTLYGSFTRVHAVYDDSFKTCAAPGCNASSALTVPAGKRIPGVAGSLAYAELAWQPRAGVQTAVEARHVGQVYVNDLNSDAAEAYTTLAWRISLAQQIGAVRLNEFVRIDNLTDRRYAGSVIVNESNARYFEPAPSRNWMLGLKLTLSY